VYCITVILIPFSYTEGENLVLWVQSITERGLHYEWCDAGWLLCCKRGVPSASDFGLWSGLVQLRGPPFCCLGLGRVDKVAAPTGISGLASSSCGGLPLCCLGLSGVDRVVASTGISGLASSKCGGSPLCCLGLGGVDRAVAPTGISGLASSSCGGPPLCCIGLGRFDTVAHRLESRTCRQPSGGNSRYAS
jgi:hypothetical protein